MPARKGGSSRAAIALPTEAPLGKKEKASPITARLEETVESLQRSLELLTVEKEQLVLRQHIVQEVCTATQYAVDIFRTYGPELEGLLHCGLQSATTVLVANLEQQITLLTRTLQAAGGPEPGQPSLDPFRGIPEALGRTKGPGGALTLLHWGLSVLQDDASAYTGVRRLDASCAQDLMKGIAEDYSRVLRDLDAAVAAGDHAAAAAAEQRIAGYFDGGGGAVVGAVMHLIQPLFTWALGEGASTDPLLLSISQPWLKDLVHSLALTRQQRAAMAAAGRVYQQLLGPLVDEQAALRKDIVALLQQMEDSSIPAAERHVDQQLQEATLVQLQERLQAAAAASFSGDDSDPATPNILWLPGLRQHHLRTTQQQQQQQVGGAGSTHRPGPGQLSAQQQQQQQQPQVLPGPDLHQELLKLVQRSQVVLWRQSWLENCELWHMYALFSWRQFAAYHVGIAGRPVHAGMLHAFVALQDAADNAPPIKVKAGRRKNTEQQQEATQEVKQEQQQQQQQQQQQTLWRTTSDPGDSSGSSGGRPQYSNATVVADSMRAAARGAAGMVHRQLSISSHLELMNADAFGTTPPSPSTVAAAAAAATASVAAAAAAAQQPQPMDAWPPAPPAAAAGPAIKQELPRPQQQQQQQPQQQQVQLPMVGSSTLEHQQQAGPAGGPASAAGSRDMSMSSGASTTGGSSGHSMAAAAASGGHEGVGRMAGQPQPAPSESLPQSLLDLLWGPDVDPDLDVTSGAPWGGL